MRLRATGCWSLAALMMATPAITAVPPRIVSVDPVRLSDGSAGGMALRLSFPDEPSSRLPVVILSHGNRLSRLDYQPIVQALARAGYLVVQPDHGDASDEGFAPATPQPADVWRSRITQLRWIATHLPIIERQVAALRGHVDSHRVAVVGHSFGGQTAALAMGADIVAPETGKIENLGIGDLRGAVLLAPPGDFDGLVPLWKQRAPYLRLDWRSMRGPVLVIAGDADTSTMTDQGAAWHEAPWRLSSPDGNKCLMRVAGGHYLGGIDSPLRAPAGDATPERRARVVEAIVAFMDKVMGRSGGASRWSALAPSVHCK